MRACAAFALQLSSARTLPPEVARRDRRRAWRIVARLAALPATEAAEREAIAESVRQAVAKAAQQRAA
ncbi:MAG: hypothetical protein R3C16_00585 [Hyphomonadaceae bacterium]